MKSLLVFLCLCSAVIAAPPYPMGAGYNGRPWRMTPNGPQVVNLKQQPAPYPIPRPEPGFIMPPKAITPEEVEKEYGPKHYKYLQDQLRENIAKINRELKANGSLPTVGTDPYRIDDELVPVITKMYLEVGWKTVEIIPYNYNEWTIRNFKLITINNHTKEVQE